MKNIEELKEYYNIFFDKIEEYKTILNKEDEEEILDLVKQIKNDISCLEIGIRRTKKITFNDYNIDDTDNSFTVNNINNEFDKKI